MVKDIEVILYIKEILGQDNIDFLREDCSKDKIHLIYTSVYNMAGIAIKNSVRNKYPEIDKQFTNDYGGCWYTAFEEWIHPLIVKAVYE